MGEKNVKQGLFYRPSYYMRPKVVNYENKIERIIDSMKARNELNNEKEYELDVNKIQTLEEAKEILNSLNLKVKIKDGLTLLNIDSYINNDFNIDWNKYLRNEHIDAFNEIKIEICDDRVDRLVRLEYGRQIYETQIKDMLNDSKKNIIFIPYNIEDLSINFIKGLLGDIAMNMGREYMTLNIEFKGRISVINKINFTINNVLF